MDEEALQLPVRRRTAADDSLGNARRAREGEKRARGGAFDAGGRGGEGLRPRAEAAGASVASGGRGEAHGVSCADGARRGGGDSGDGEKGRAYAQRNARAPCAAHGRRRALPRGSGADAGSAARGGRDDFGAALRRRALSAARRDRQREDGGVYPSDSRGAGGREGRDCAGS